ncbi:MAG: M1 family aminopeptidase [Candidatus Sedimenticola sp. PURPLELP]
MKQNLFLIVIILVAAVSTQAWADETTIHHRLDVSIDPDKGVLQVKDHLTLPGKTTKVEFLLNADLKVTPITDDVRIRTVAEIQSSVRLKRYQAVFSKPGNQLALTYHGTIRQQLKNRGQGYADGREGTTGLISGKGVFLGLSSFWYPAIDHHPVSFNLSAKLPEGWSSVSQGIRTETGDWQELSPQDGIYLIAGRYHSYTRKGKYAQAQVYLSTPDSELADKYLKATNGYISLYQQLLGPYPYKKFALVENFWESGYGMPSFTLLGPRVIRLPFIILTSYPHEILHNWWGNGVFVDYETGNWSEGLTSYLADHLMKEQLGKGADYRRDTLRSYADYVAEKDDFPLSEFRGNHGQVSQAVGYGKTLMLFHMLRQKLGDRVFVDGLRRFYNGNLFKVAGFNDIRKAFETASGEQLEHDFKQWTGRTGAPSLALDEVKVSQGGKGYIVSGRLTQTQKEKPYRLRVPLFTQVEGRDLALKRVIDSTARTTTFKMEFKKRPLRLSVDPRFDIFRKLHDSEIPSSLGQLFGAERLAFILPSDASRTMRRSYEQMAEQWADGNDRIEILWDADLEELPVDRAVWLLGAENSFSTLFKEQIGDDILTLESEQYILNNFSAALTRRHPGNSALTLGLISLHDRDALSGFARKLPHYGKYSYVVFDGDELINRVKGHWVLSESALSLKLDKTGKLPEISIPPHKPITDILEYGNEEEDDGEDDEEC